ncbi:MAG: hypothetical protein CM15mP52_2660 [Candidatus Neomarinimicrobiota bacterium]|nr:MAG: hypothetical protein CM15mP52_2660 [Candidatus Neomarinimicrobiota bacterium]
MGSDNNQDWPNLKKGMKMRIYLWAIHKKRKKSCVYGGLNY